MRTWRKSLIWTWFGHACCPKGHGVMRKENDDWCMIIAYLNNLIEKSWILMVFIRFSNRIPWWNTHWSNLKGLVNFKLYHFVTNEQKKKIKLVFLQSLKTCLFLATVSHKITLNYSQAFPHVSCWRINSISSAVRKHAGQQISVCCPQRSVLWKHIKGHFCLKKIQSRGLELTRKRKQRQGIS